jgi:uncharacterized membrane protein YoaK (UPF0700 family)
MLRIDGAGSRSFARSTALAATLSFAAGAVNASGLLAAGAMTSHMTGNLTRVGEGVALGRAEALEPARYLLFFFFGAIAATLATTMLRRRGSREPVPPLLLVEATLLASVALMGWFADHPMLVTELLCLAMGWQNALITRISSAVVRTTHVTGIMTDLGIEVGNLLLVPSNVTAPARLTERLRHAPADSDLARAMLHFATIVCFFLGATVGPLLFLRFGYRAVLAPALVLVVLVSVDRVTPRAPGS